MARGTVNVPGAGLAKQNEALVALVKSLEELQNMLAGIPEGTTVAEYIKENFKDIDPEDFGAASREHDHTIDNISDFPTSMPPTAHDHAASSVTAGTFAGQVVANASGQTPGTYLVRNSKLSASEETPTVNGQICWQYE